ncbi:hypothetical protein ACFYY5_29165 [Nocardia elegans]|uniref:Secreted protein n=1 Tax=Nocardia elegans TaxID=300029 RepID=A0ABW6TLB0_9NOCA
MNLKRGAATAALAGATLIPLLGTSPASATDSPPVYGRQACYQLEDQYRAMGYNTRCYNTQGDWFYVHYEKPRPGELPSTGSAGSS